ncbi:3-coathanger stack domain-containing protein [Emticicia sp. 17c]|uniref:3-coathanger stack domain-containing protein n=1 Tax=Emticicia sp. 17c TaxID=3127704 RepID=UPI00301C8E17
MFKLYFLLFLLITCQLVNAQSISISFNAKSLCKGQVEKVNFTASGDFNPDNYFTIQLSDTSGSFDNAIELSRFTNGALQEARFTVPDSIGLGTRYRIRAVSSSPLINSAPTDTLSVTDTCKMVKSLPVVRLQPLASNQICISSQFTVSWTISADSLSEKQVFTIELSDTSGIFTTPHVLAVTDTNATRAAFTIPAGFPESNNYRIRITGNNPEVVSDTTSILSIHSPPTPFVTIIPSKPCLGDTVRIIANAGTLGEASFLWSGAARGTSDTLLIQSAGPTHVGFYEVSVTQNGCSASASANLILNNCKPEWAWALADTFWTNTFNYPSTIVDTEIDADDNLFIAGFFSQKMNLGNTVITTLEGSNIFCDNSQNADKRTGFIAKINANGTLAWYRKWNTSAEISDYQYCDLAIDNGQIFLVSEFKAGANCPTNPRNGTSLVIADEEDFALGTIVGYCRYVVPNVFPTQYEYRYKGHFTWVAKFDINGNLDILTNLTELKACGVSASNFDTRPAYGLGTNGNYSLKARNGKLWLLYTWNQGLNGTLKFSNGNESANEGAGITFMQLNPDNLAIMNYQKLNVYSPVGVLGMSNIEIDAENNILLTGSTATIVYGNAQAITFGETQLIFGGSGYFLGKFNTTINQWAWAKQSYLTLPETNTNLAPAIRTDAQNNVYLGFSLAPAQGGYFANVSFPVTPEDFSPTNTAALLKVNTNGNGEWVRYDNHLIGVGRNQMGIDKNDNIYFATYLKNTPEAAQFLINDHRLPYPDLATFSSASGNTFISIYKPDGNLQGSVNNIRVYDALYVNGLVVDSDKNIFLSGVNYGKAKLGNITLATNFGEPSDNQHNRARGFISKIGNPQSIALADNQSLFCTRTDGQIAFNTTGSFQNTIFKAELIDATTHKAVTVVKGTTSPLSFTIADSLAGKQYYARVSTDDNTIIGTVRPKKLIEINTTLVPVISSNLLGTTPLQGICYTSLPDYRIQSNIEEAQITLQRNGETMYSGQTLNFAPTEQQTGTYKILVDNKGCTSESSEMNLKVSRPATARIIGDQILTELNQAAYLTLTLSGGGEYEVNISGVSSPFKLNNTYETIAVYPTQNTDYNIVSVSNYCGLGTVEGLARVSICRHEITLSNPTDNYTSGLVKTEASNLYGSIVASNQISDSANVVYSAGKSIMLTPGFSVSDSSIFTAEIKGCNSVSTSENSFKIGYQKLHINKGNVDRTLVEMSEYAQRGANMFEVTLRLDEVFKSLSQFNETDTSKLNQYWSIYDKVVKHAYNTYDHVVFRINVDYDDTRYYFQDRDENDPTQTPYNNYDNALFNLFGEIVQDQFNNPARIAYGSGHGSFSSMSATAKMKGFVQKALDRYYPVLKQKLYWVSAVSTAQFETGFNFENSWTGYDFISPHPCEYDYSPDNVNAFRNWLVTERYSGIGGVNTAYGTNYNEAGDIEPPKVPVQILEQMNTINILVMYNSVLFEDWYKFNYKQMKKFLLDCKAIVKEKSSAIKFCFEAGACADQISAARKTFDVPDMNNYVDVLKTNMPTITFDGQQSWEGDVIRSNFNGEIETEINEMDIVNMAGITEPLAVKQVMLNYSKNAYLNKAKAVIFVSDKNTPYYNNSLDAVAELKNWVNNHTEVLTEGETIHVNLSDLIRNFQAARTPFNMISNSLPNNGYQNRPRIIINQNNQ